MEGGLSGTLGRRTPNAERRTPHPARRTPKPQCWRACGQYPTPAVVACACRAPPSTERLEADPCAEATTHPRGMNARQIDVPATLRTVRHIRKLSQRDLAARAGVPPSTIDRIEAGT